MTRDKVLPIFFEFECLTIVLAGFREPDAYEERAHSSFLGMVSIGTTRSLGAKKELNL